MAKHNKGDIVTFLGDVVSGVKVTGTIHKFLYPEVDINGNTIDVYEVLMVEEDGEEFIVTICDYQILGSLHFSLCSSK